MVFKQLILFKKSIYSSGKKPLEKVKSLNVQLSFEISYVMIKHWKYFKEHFIKLSVSAFNMTWKIQIHGYQWRLVENILGGAVEMVIKQY